MKTFKSLLLLVIVSYFTACSTDETTNQENAIKTCESEGLSFTYEDLGNGTVETVISQNNKSIKQIEKLPENTSFEAYAKNACDAVNTEKLTKAETAAVLYEHCNYNGWSVALEVGEYNVNDLINRGAPNDKLSSVRVSSGYGITLYEHRDFGGRSLTFNGDDICIYGNVVDGLDFNDKTSSIKIFRLGGDASFDVTKVSVTNTNNGTPKKGDPLYFDVTIRNTGNSRATKSITPFLSSKRFDNYNNVSTGTVSITLEPGASQSLRLQIGPFIYDAITRKHYALGRGDYTIDAFRIDDKRDTNFEGKNFSVGASNAVLVPVLYEESYLTQQRYTKGVLEYVRSSFTRPVILYDDNSYRRYNGGTDQMMNIRQIFHPVSGLDFSRYSEPGNCEKGVAEGGRLLGLGHDWRGPDVGTQKTNHGFDYLMCLTPAQSGGVACGWLNVQVSGLFNFDLSLNRSQILVVHESGHLFGSPHCDPRQGYVMCAGEKHQLYQQDDLFVFHKVSRDRMSNRWD